ncbi:MAG: tetratricopeptide repeat protein [Candidatus Hodarchaeales archaeon]|jgi:tetratricopeptide (TPR) repeat protein
MSTPLIAEAMKRLAGSMKGVIERRIFSKITHKLFNKDFFEGKIQELSISEFQQLLEKEFRKEGMDIKNALEIALSETKESLNEIKGDIASLWSRTDANLVELMDDDPETRRDLTLIRLELAETFARLKEDTRAIENYLGRLRFELSSINMVVLYQQFETRQAMEKRLNEILQILSLICKKLDIEISIPDPGVTLLGNEEAKIELLDDRTKRLFNKAVSELSGVIRPATPLPLREMRKKMTNQDLDTLLKASNLLFKDGDHQRSLAISTQVLQLDPDNGRAKFNRALALKADGRYKSAAEELRELLDDPEFEIEAACSLADILCRQSKIDEALALMATIESNQPGVLYMKAHVTLSAGFYKASIKIYKKLLKRDWHERLFDVHTNVGVAYSKLGKDKKAVVHFKKALSLTTEEKNLTEAHFNLGYSYYKLNHRREAKKHFQEAVKIDPRNTKAHLNLGLCQQAFKRHDEAVHSFNKVITLDPGLQTAWYRGAISYAHLGSRKLAARYHEKAATLEH